MSIVMSRNILSKEELTYKALQFDEKENITPSIAYMKGFREAIKLCLPYLQDSFRHKIQELIK